MVMWLPGCPVGIRLQALKDSFRDFTNRTESWTEELAKVNLVADQQNYTLAAAKGGMVKRIVWVKISGGQVASEQYDLVNDYNLQWKDDYIPNFSKSDGLQVKVVLYPEWGTNNTDFDPDYMRRFGEGVISKALYDLKIQPNKDWTDRSGAKEWYDKYLTQFNDAVKERFVQSKAGSLKVALRAAQMP
jgi:hypothetical protein